MNLLYTSLIQREMVVFGIINSVEYLKYGSYKLIINVVIVKTIILLQLVEFVCIFGGELRFKN